MTFLMYLGGYLAIGFATLAVVLKLRPDWAWTEKVEHHKIGTKKYSAGALEEKLGVMAGGFDKWIEANYGNSYMAFMPRSDQKAQWRSYVLTALNEIAEKEWEIRERRHVGWESPDKFPWAETGITLCWPLAIPAMIGSIVIRSTQRSVNNKTRTRAELEKELAEAKKEVDDLMRRGEV